MKGISSWLQILVNVSFTMTALAFGQSEASTAKPGPEFIRVSEDGRHFVFSDSGAAFRPWGFNYDHDASNRLLDTYWKKEWSAVVGILFGGGIGSIHRRLETTGRGLDWLLLGQNHR